MLRCHPPHLKPVALLALLLAPAVLSAQPPTPPGLPTPRLLLVLPCGGQQGATAEFVVTGQDLDDTETLHFNFPGVKVEPLGPTTGPKTDPGKPPPKGAPGTNSYRFKVTLPAGAPLGIQDVRVVTKFGISNPRAFVIGDHKEYVEQEPNNDTPQAQRIELNSSVSGVIGNPTDVDYFRVAVKKGQRVVVSCLSTSIDSRLPAAIQIYGGDNYLGFNRNYSQNDALYDFVAPADGDYDVRVFSYGYTQAGADHFYRLTVTTAPWIDAIHPCAVEPGKATDVTVYGRNLPGGQPDPTAVVDGRPLEKLTYRVTAPAAGRLTYSGFVSPHAAALDAFEVRLKNAAGVSNPYLLAVARAPVVLDNEANDTSKTAQKVQVPCEIAGRVEKKTDRDLYAFTAKKGAVYSIELYAERLGAPLDLSLVLRRAGSDTALVELEDTTDIVSPQFYTRTDDPPRYRFVVPADGDYELLVTSRDAFTQAGPRHIYRLRVSTEQPDFRVIAMPPGGNTPDAAIVRRAGQQAFTVFAWRLDGWDGDITVTAEGLPPGVTMPPQVIPAGQKQSALVLSAEGEAPLWTGVIRLRATAKIKGQDVTRDVLGATASWPLLVQQQNTPNISRVDRELALAVREKGPFSLTGPLTKLTVLQGDKLKVPVKLERFWPELTGPLQITAPGLPPAFIVAPVTLAPGKDTGEVVIDTKPAIVPGTYTVVLRGSVQVTPTKSMPVMKKGPLTISQPSTPLSVTVLPRQLVKGAGGGGGGVKLKVGQKTDVGFTLTRLYDAGGDYKVELILPAGTKGIEVTPATLAIGQGEVKLGVRVAADATPATVNGVLLRVTADFNGTPVTQDVKTGLVLTK